MREQGTIIRRRYYPNKYGSAEWWLLLTIRENRKTITVSGVSNIIPSEGDYIIAYGNYTEDADRKFKASKLTILEPQETDYIINRLQNFGILDDETIYRLVKLYGKGIWDRIERKELGLKEDDKLKATFKLWKRRSDKEDAEIEVARYFESINLPLENKEPVKIVRSLGTKAYKLLLKNPLYLCQILNSKFLRRYAKAIGMEKGIKDEMIFLVELFEELRDGKDLCAPNEFEDKYTEIVNSLIEKKYLKKYKDFVYINPPPETFLVEDYEDENQSEEINNIPAIGNYNIELFTAESINELLRNPIKIECPNLKSIIEENNLTEEQTNALELFMQNRISLVFGGPGNGKTKMISAVVALAYSIGATFTLLAPTGRAAKRIRELMNEKSYTIHSWLLNLKLEKTRFLIIDECSMIDSYLLYKIFKSGSFERILMLGDTNQIPPISSGYPFLELRKCSLIPRAILTRNFRFDKNSEGIPNALKCIISGNPNIRDCGEGLTIINTSNISKYLIKEVKKHEEFNVDVFRVLTPLRKIVNSEMYNIRNLYMPDIEEEEEIKPGDWIICRKNLTVHDICNGDIGSVSSIDDVEVLKEVIRDGVIEMIEKTERHYFINFYGRIVELDSSSYFSLAYITTVHSSQGGESDHIILAMETDSKINTRQLLYTAVSRAKKSVVILAPNQVISMMITRKQESRFSCLKMMIEDIFNKTDIKQIEL